MSLDAILASLRRCRFLHASERDLQEGLAASLTADGFDVAREVSLDARCRIDLLVGRVGIEVKVDGGWRDVRRQLERYAAFERLDALILVTTKPMHTRIPAELGGKPVIVHRVGSAL